MDHPIVFPPIKELTISHPPVVHGEEECTAAIVELAKSQHALGLPFERVTVRARKLPAGMAGILEPWVGVADCCEGWCIRAHDEWDLRIEYHIAHACVVASADCRSIGPVVYTDKFYWGACM